jgi:hypothetical protein
MRHRDGALFQKRRRSGFGCNAGLELSLKAGTTVRRPSV